MDAKGRARGFRECLDRALLTASDLLAMSRGGTMKLKVDENADTTDADILFDGEGEVVGVARLQLIDAMVEDFRDLARGLVTNLPASRERSLALTKLQEAFMWASRAPWVK